MSFDFLFRQLYTNKLCWMRQCLLWLRSVKVGGVTILFYQDICHWWNGLLFAVRTHRNVMPFIQKASIEGRRFEKTATRNGRTQSTTECSGKRLRIGYDQWATTSGSQTIAMKWVTLKVELRQSIFCNFSRRKKMLCVPEERRIFFPQNGIKSQNLIFGVFGGICSFRGNRRFLLASSYIEHNRSKTSQTVQFIIVTF